MKRFDLHAHYLPEFYRQALLGAGHDHPDGMPAVPEWSEHDALALMDRLGIQTAMLSISSPGVHFGDDDAAGDLARRCNEEGMRLKQRHPERFGYFAILPLPTVEASIEELRHAFDELDADGVVLLTNHQGTYLGDPRLEPLYEELNRRQAIVFLHPTSPHCCASELALGYPRPMIEFLFDTTRSVVNLIISGVLERHQNLRVIVPHAGAALPVLANRIEMLLPFLFSDSDGERPEMRAALERLHFDLAGAPVAELLEALLRVADPARIHYGSDYPFTPAPFVERLAEQLDRTELLDPALREQVMFDNAQRLFTEGTA